MELNADYCAPVGKDRPGEVEQLDVRLPRGFRTVFQGYSEADVDCDPVCRITAI